MYHCTRLRPWRVAILLQAGLVFRAIETNIRLFNWDRALELAVRLASDTPTI